MKKILPRFLRSVWCSTRYDSPELTRFARKKSVEEARRGLVAMNLGLAYWHMGKMGAAQEALVRQSHIAEDLAHAKAELEAVREEIVVTGTNVFRIANGKIVQCWAQMDALGMMQQLGVIPPMG